MKKAYCLVICIFSVVFSFVSGVSAQDPGLLGEIQSSGRVFISGPDGRWLPAMPSYPLLQNTGVKTENGGVSVFFKDGSRLDLSKDTLVSITGEAPDYTINLAKGVIAFNIMPLSSLSIATPSASVAINSREEMVRKVGHENSGRILGVVSATEKGTEVTSISGDIKVTSSSAGTKKVATGERVIFGPGSSYQVYKTQAKLGDGVALSGSGSGLPLFGLTAAGETLILIGINGTLSDNGSLASPSTFGNLP